MQSNSYVEVIWGEFKKSKIGLTALFILALFFLIGVYAPFFASGKPVLVLWHGELYFPLFRYLFFSGFYTKPIDIFFNLGMFTLPCALICMKLSKKNLRRTCLVSIVLLHTFLFSWIISGVVKDPAHNPVLSQARAATLEDLHKHHEDPLLAPSPSQTGWDFELEYMSPYAQLNQLLKYKHIRTQHQRLAPHLTHYAEKIGGEMPTLWYVWQRNEETQLEHLMQALHTTEGKYLEAHKQLPELMEAYRPFSHASIIAKYALDHAVTTEEKNKAKTHLENITKEAATYRLPLEKARQIIFGHQKTLAALHFFDEKQQWLLTESENLRLLIPSLIRTFHWEEDAGGAQEANRYLPWWELTRINRKDFVASLLFGIRVSIVVGFSAVFLALLIGIPLGTLAGYFAGKTDLLICRIIEIWEAMPTFFMLLLVVAITHSKSIFLVIGVLGFFGWTSIARFIRSEVLRQRKLSYVLACQSLGFTHLRIMFSHILPNAIPPILTLLPFSMMAAITSEAGLSFLGLGEEGSTSWGVLMDEGRSVFPAESYLLWPPAILLTLLLICIALVGDRLRDALDPKMR